MACMEHECIGDIHVGLKPCGFWTSNNEIMRTCPKCGGSVTSIFDEDPRDEQETWEDRTDWEDDEEE